ncbi:MAG: squalene/phytoene synthase family protein, partial [Solirubrobacteraceae bacterium]
MTIPALETEYACRRCEQITRREAANFYYGIRLLPRAKRDAMSAVYAFARRVDDIGDGDDLGHEARLAALTAEREMLTRIEQDRVACADPVEVALAYARRCYDVPPDALQMLIDGVELDVLGTRYETFDELVGYCRRVAGSIGRLCVAIFSDGHGDASHTASLADDLGVAMQLTNILRDVREDRELGRCYLPAEDLRRFGCPDLAADTEQARLLIRFEAGRAAAWFDHGLQLTAALDARSASCVLAMSGIYRSILHRIVNDPSLVLRGRISLPPWEKAWVAARSLAAAR